MQFNIDFFIELTPNYTDLRILHFLSDPQMPIILVAPSNRAICPAKIPHAPAAPDTTNVNGLKKNQNITIQFLGRFSIYRKNR